MIANRPGHYNGFSLASLSPVLKLYLLTSNYEGYLEYQATYGRRELTEDDLTQVETQRQIMLAKLQQ